MYEKDKKEKDLAIKCADLNNKYPKNFSGEMFFGSYQVEYFNGCNDISNYYKEVSASSEERKNDILTFNLAPEEFKNTLKEKNEELVKPDKTVLAISVPGMMRKNSILDGNPYYRGLHSITALIDNKEKKITVNDPLYGEIDNGEPRVFPRDIVDILKKTFPLYEIEEQKVNFQKTGENICVYLTLKKAQAFLKGNKFFSSREEILQDWGKDMEFFNKLTTKPDLSDKWIGYMFLGNIYSCFRKLIIKKLEKTEKGEKGKVFIENLTRIDKEEAEIQLENALDKYIKEKTGDDELSVANIDQYFEAYNLDFGSAILTKTWKEKIDDFIECINQYMIDGDTPKLGM